MSVLAFDTATGATAVAVDDYEARDDVALGARPNHTERLLELIEHCVEYGGGWTAIERIAVGTGPGTFTGLRIGLATAQALSFATGLPLVGVSTLAALEHRVRRELGDQRPVLAAIDARRGEVFLAGGGIEPRVVKPEELLGIVAPVLATGGAEEMTRDADNGAGQRASARPLAVGDGAIRFREVLLAAGAEVPPADSPLHRVCAIDHCELAWKLTPGSVADVKPSYLRVPDAELNLGSAVGR